VLLHTRPITAVLQTIMIPAAEEEQKLLQHLIKTNGIMDKENLCY
jgi:hypothetical protein